MIPEVVPLSPSYSSCHNKPTIANTQPIRWNAMLDHSSAKGPGGPYGRFKHTVLFTAPTTGGPSAYVTCVGCFQHQPRCFPPNTQSRLNRARAVGKRLDPKPDASEEVPVLGRSRPATLYPTTSFLTATELVYTIGAGVTAGAGTRLVLQLLLTEKFNHLPLRSLGSLRLQEPLFLVATSPLSAFGQFTRLLPILIVVAISHAPSPESNPNSPLPVKALVGKCTTNKLMRQKLSQRRIDTKPKPSTDLAFACLHPESSI